MKQFNIRKVLEKNQIVPVATISDLKDIDALVEKLLKQGISCIEVTLRTSVAIDAIEYLKQNYSNELDIGVGTIVTKEQLQKVVDLEVDFIVSPGLMEHLTEDLQKAKIPFIPGVVTPTEIMRGIALGYDTFKFFPAEIFGGIKTVKAYSNLFPELKFCPTGGINQSNHQDYLALSNVISVGGSWVV